MSSPRLKELESIRAEYGGDAAARKLALIETLERRSLPSGGLRRFHEALCWLRAYPDDDQVLRKASSILSAFGTRRDLRRRRGDLYNTGIAGTTTWYPFFWPTARWLAKRWPDRLHIDWVEWKNRDRLLELLPLLMPYSESVGLDEAGLEARDWIRTLKGADETDGAFLVRRFEALKTDEFGREAMFESLEVPMRLDPGPGWQARGDERHAPSPVSFQDRPLDRGRPDLRRAARRPPVDVRDAGTGEARRLIDVARAAMVNRIRDLDAFANADPTGVRIVDCGGGLQFAAFCARPERRLMLESSYGFLTLKNGVPIGYVLASALFGSAAIAYNVFETFRGGEAGHIFGWILGMARALFGVDTFSIDPYQLGHHNAEGLHSGAWWFYHKIGFRPVDPDVLEVLNAELKRMRRNPRHRSDLATLRKLVVDDVYFHLGRPREDVLGKVDLGDIGLAISGYLAGRFGAEREAGLRTCAREAARRYGLRSTRAFSRGEKLMWQRWSPLLLALPGVERWSAAERRAAVLVVRAKGGRHESEFVPLFDRHRKLRKAVLGLAAE